MNEAMQWAKAAVAIQAAQPKFECLSFVETYGEEKEAETHLVKVAVVLPTLHLNIISARLSPADARALARWILATYGDREPTS